MLPLRSGYKPSEAGLVEDAKTQEIGASAAVHLVFDQLESMHLPFDMALTPRQRQGGFGGFQISFEP